MEIDQAKTAGASSNAHKPGQSGRDFPDSPPLLSDARVGVALAPMDHVSYDRGLVRALIAEAIEVYTGGRSDLGCFLHGGERVLIKPNWVLHMNQSGAGMDCMITHPQFLLAVVELVAARKPSRIVIGDAPLQSCKWDALVTPAFVQELRDRAPGVPIEFIDFRRTVLKGETLGSEVEEARRSRDRYVLFDLGGESLLEPITGEGTFRVTSYNPEELAKTHCPGRHQYLLARDVFEADVVLNLPKLKTHRKSGLTAALKNLVGINGNKDYLPHHRMGGSDIGGDCYPGFFWWKHSAEMYYDLANSFIGTPLHDMWLQRAENLLALYGRHFDTDIEGGWYGNDTCWRMNLDLNRCLIYGDTSGAMHDHPQRRLLNLTDAIIAGQAEGPLAPTPLALGAVTFSEMSAAADLAHGALFRFDHRRLGLLKGCFAAMRFPLLPSGKMPQFFTKHGILDYESLASLHGRAAQPPRGWKGHCELSPISTQRLPLVLV